MRIELNSPFKELYKRAYLRTSKDGRKRIDLVNSQYDRTTISYARYLVCVNIGRMLTSDEEVDHKDNDFRNDSLDNLQVLTKEAHLEKTLKERSKRKKVEIECPYCGVLFNRWANQLSKRKRAFCSRSCNAKFHHSK